ncbi:hypothetical protein GCM10020219_062140 [Nonomuraea dietziae]
MDMRWTVIARLQGDLTHVTPGSDREHIIERAMDLALSEGRGQQDPERLYWDVLRNAQYVFYRSKRRGHIAWTRYTGQLDIVLADEGIDVREPCDKVEDEAEGNALWRHLKAGAAELGSFGPSFLESLAETERPAEAAVTSGISRATAYRCVAALRKQLGAWLGEAA